DVVDHDGAAEHVEYAIDRAPVDDRGRRAGAVDGHAASNVEIARRRGILVLTGDGQGVSPRRQRNRVGAATGVCRNDGVAQRAEGTGAGAVVAVRSRGDGESGGRCLPDNRDEQDCYRQSISYASTPEPFHDVPLRLETSSPATNSQLGQPSTVALRKASLRPRP